MIYTLSFPPPAPLMNMNNRGAWYVHHPLKVAWRDATRTYARQAIIKKQIPRHLPFSIVEFDFPVQSMNVRRDPHNVYPTIKAILDGCVLAELWRDDNSEHLATTEPRFHDSRPNLNVIITITTKEDQ